MKKSFAVFLLSSLIFLSSFEAQAGMVGKIIGGAAVSGAVRLMGQNKADSKNENASSDLKKKDIMKKGIKKVAKKTAVTRYGKFAAPLAEFAVEGPTTAFDMVDKLEENTKDVINRTKKDAVNAGCLWCQ